MLSIMMILRRILISRNSTGSKYLFVTGSGPFALPGEQRRLKVAEDKANETMSIINSLPGG